VQGSIAYFGTYSVSETDKTCAIHIESSTFPNWIGTDQKRSFTISGDELKWTTPTVSLGSGTLWMFGNEPSKGSRPKQRMDRPAR
jgi:hypothetical protein